MSSSGLEASEQEVQDVLENLEGNDSVPDEEATILL